MWNDWLSSMSGPGNESMSHDIVEVAEPPKRFHNPQQMQRLQELQRQHQELQVQQLHLLNKQHLLSRMSGALSESGGSDGVSTAPQSPSSGALSQPALAMVDFPKPRKDKKSLVTSASNMQEVKSEIDDEDEDPAGDDDDDHQPMSRHHDYDDMDDTHSHKDGGSLASLVNAEVWQQFHALQAQQWAQALSQARTVKQRGGMSGLVSPSVPAGSLSIATPVGSSGIGLLSSFSGGSSSGMLGLGAVAGSGGLNGSIGGKRCKAYAAPKGVWKNNGGYNATIYVHKRRIYGPIRRDLSDAIEDRKEMEDALRELSAHHSSPEDAAILEIEMREVVAGLRNRATPGGPPPPSVPSGGSSNRFLITNNLTGSTSPNFGPSSNNGYSSDLNSNGGGTNDLLLSSRKKLKLISSSSTAATSASGGMGVEDNMDNNIRNTSSGGHSSTPMMGPFSSVLTSPPAGPTAVNHLRGDQNFLLSNDILLLPDPVASYRYSFAPSGGFHHARTNDNYLFAATQSSPDFGFAQNPTGGSRSMDLFDEMGGAGSTTINTAGLWGIF